MPNEVMHASGIPLSGWERIAGWGVTETPVLRYDELIVDSQHRVVLCGEIAHLSYLIQMEYLKDAIREDVKHIIERLAEWAHVDSQVVDH